MGRTAVHSQEQVFEAADKLAANGQEVSPNALRDLLGRGSYSTFVKHIDAWHQARKAAPPPVILEMPESVKVAFAQCWQAAAGEAGKEIAAIREKADVEIKATKRRLDEAIAAIELLEAEGEVDATRLEAAESNLVSERAASQLAVTNAAARESALAATAEQMRQQIAAQQAELASVHTEAEAARAQHASELARITSDFSRQISEQSVVLKDCQTELERMRGELTELKTDNHILNDVFERQKVEIGELEEAKSLLDSELNAAHREIQDQAQKLGKATGALESLKAQVASQTELIKGFSGSVGSDKKAK